MKKNYTLDFRILGQKFKTYAGIIILTLFAFQPNLVSAQWTRKSDALRKRAECPSVLYQGKIYVFGGFGEHPNFENANEVYDPASDKWSLIDSFPPGKAISHQELVLVDDKIWHIGGRAVNADGPLSSQVIIYDITHNVWMNGPQLTDPSTGKPLTIGGGGAALVGRTIHYFGGFAPTICIDQSKYHLTLDVDKWLANPQTTTWENKLAPMPTPRNHLNTVVYSGKIYALGGQFGHDCNGADQKYCHVYDPTNDTWTRLTDLPFVRSHAEAATLPVDGKFYLIGGQGPANAAQNTVLMFTPGDNGGLGSWATATQYQLPNNYYGISAKVIGDTFIISHGALNNVTNEQMATYTTTIARNIPYQLGFTAACYSKTITPNQKIVVNNLLYTIESETQYSLTSNASWLTITKNATGLTSTSATDIEATIDATGLAFGNYTGMITAIGSGSPAFAGASFCVNLVVTSAGYTLSVTPNGSGTVSKTPDQTTYASGTSVALTATPALGQQFTGWSGDTTVSTNPLNVIMNSNKVITANFTQASFTVSNITTTTGHTYTLSQLATGTTVYTDRAYVATSVPANLNNAPFIEAPNDDKANKSANVLSFNINQNGTVYIAYDPRSTVLPAWLSSFQKLSGQVIGVNDPKVSSMQLYSKNFLAGTVTLGGNLQSPAAGALNNYFAVIIPQTTPVQYNLTVTTNGNGTVSKNPNQASYNSGTSVILTATPAAGQQFTGWSGSVTSTSNPLTLTMDADKSVTATFAPVSQYNLTVSTSGNGTVSKNPDQVSYSSGTSVTLTATPAAGQQFTGWSGDATGSTNPLTIIMNADKVITANFSQASAFTITNITTTTGRAYTLGYLVTDSTVYTDRTYVATTVPANLNNAFLIKTANDDKANKSANLLSFNINQNATVYIAYDPRATALPAWLSSFQKLTGQTIGVNESHINSMQLYSKDFSAGTVTLGGSLQSPAAGALNNYFVIVVPQTAAVQYTLNVTASGNGTVAKNPDQPTYSNGTSVTLTATPATGLQFTGWSGDATGSTNPLTVTMDANKAIAANFSAAPSFAITNLTTTSGRSYVLSTLYINNTVYTDRTYVATTVPANLNNAPLIKTPNDDKANKSASLFSFTINQDATIYIAYDPRATVLPSWLSSFQKLTGQVIGVNDPKISSMQLYSKNFSAGTITLGGNLQSPAAGALNNYFVIAVPATSTMQANTIMAGNQKIITVQNQVSLLQHKQSAVISFKVYPNPNPGDKINIEVNNFSKQESVTIIIEDELGNIINSIKVLTDQQGSFNKEIRINKAFSKGIYIIKAVSASGSFQKKLIIN